MRRKISKPNRKIDPMVTALLWGRAAGRCQFRGCQRNLCYASVSGDLGNFAERAHVYSFEKNGPRGHEALEDPATQLNAVDNLLLLCTEHHTNIDKPEYVSKYPATLLLQWKKEHEDRVRMVTAIDSNRISRVLTYQANINGTYPPIAVADAQACLFAEGRYPNDPLQPIDLSMKWESSENQAHFWTIAQNELQTSFARHIKPIISRDKNPHFSIFALAPMPLLIELGVLFSDRADVDIYQPIKEPKGWQWPNDKERFEYVIERPEQSSGIPVLVLALSDDIHQERITRVLGDSVSIWKLTLPEEHRHNDHLRSKAQLSVFRSTMRQVLAEIRQSHPHSKALHIFPAAPVSYCIELGRVRTQKVDHTWVIYDHVKPQEAFIETITIGDPHE